MKCIFAHGDAEIRTPKDNIDQIQVMQHNLQFTYMSQMHQVQQTYDLQNSKRQLKYVIEKFRSLHKDDPKSIKMLEEADQYLGSEDVYSCANKIQCIINEHNNTQMNQVHSTVIEEAKTAVPHMDMMAFPQYVPMQLAMPTPTLPKA